MKFRPKTPTFSRFWRFAAGSELRRNIVETYGARIFAVVVAFATAVVISRALGPAGRGFYAVAAAIAAIGVQLGSLGLNSSNIYYVAKDRALLPALLGNTLAAGLIAVLLAVVGGVGYALWPNLAPLGGTLFLLALASVPVGLAYLLMQGLLLGVNEVRAYNLIECGGKLFALLVICLFAAFRLNSAELFFGITLLAAVVSFLWALLRLARVSPARPVVSLAVFRQTIGLGVKAYLILFFGFLVLRIDLLMVKYMLGATQAGYYSISQVLAENTMMLPVVIGLLLFPKLSGLNDREGKLRLSNRAVLTTAAFMLPIVVIGALVAAPAISIAFGRDFLPAASPFVWLMPGTYFLAIEVVMVQLLNSEGFPRAIVVAWIADTVLNIALNFWAIPRYGIVGASVVSSVCYFLIFVVVSAMVWKRFYKTQPAAVYVADPQPM